jgi:hypothetical protein
MQHFQCITETAIDVTQKLHVQNELMCGKLGQTLLAGTAIAPREGIEYAKSRQHYPVNRVIIRWLSSASSYLARLQ